MKRTATFPYTIDFGFGIREDHKLFLVAESYQSNNSLAISVYEETEYGDDYFDTITVNISDSDFAGGSFAGGSLAFIDTNNCSWAEKMLKKMKLAKDTGVRGYSGFCSYPLYEFNLKKFSE